MKKIIAYGLEFNNLEDVASHFGLNILILYSVMNKKEPLEESIETCLEMQRSLIDICKFTRERYDENGEYKW